MQTIQYIAENYDIPENIAAVLVKKGINNKALADALFNPVIAELLPVETLPNANRAIERILSAAGKGKKILIWGHEDADGVTSVAIMLRVLRSLGAECDYYIPSKSREGHGLYKNAIDKLADRGINVIITVDCCSSNKNEVDYAASKGIEIIITDHHEIKGDIGNLIMVNPKLGGDSFRYLAGVGVAFKIAYGVIRRKQNMEILEFIKKFPELLVFSSIGTVADRVPPFSENAIFINEGSTMIHNSSLPFIDVLRKRYNTEPTMEQLVGVVSSGISVEGKLKTVDMLLSRSYIEAEELITPLFEQVISWQSTTSALLKKAREKIGQLRDYIIVDMGKVEPRYLGYIANQLKQQYNLPAIVMGRREDGTATAEVRVPYGFDSLLLLDYISQDLITYGGHKLASGFSVEEWDIPYLIEEIEKFFKEHHYSNEKPFADLEVSDQKNLKFYRTLEKLGKLGVEMRILIKGIKVNYFRKNLKESFTFINDQLIDKYLPEKIISILISTTQEGLKILNIYESF